MVLRRGLVVATVALVVGVTGACSPGTTDSLTSGSTGPASHHDVGAVVITLSTPGPTLVVVGQPVVVELRSESYGRDGHVVLWGEPESSNHAVLAPAGRPRVSPCPAATTCGAFVGSAPGVATVSAPGPSGVVCTARGNRCVGVTAVIRRFVVRVVRA